MIDVLVKKLDDNAKIPFKKYEDDFCYDCVAVSKEEIAPNVFKYGLGLAFQMSADSLWESIIISLGLDFNEDDIDRLKNMFDISIDVRPRSSISDTGLVLCNSEGTVDFGYTNEVSCKFYHVIPTLPEYNVGDKVCQIKIGITPKMNFLLSKEFEERKRGLNGFGSTGK